MKSLRLPSLSRQAKIAFCPPLRVDKTVKLLVAPVPALWSRWWHGFILQEACVLILSQVLLIWWVPYGPSAASVCPCWQLSWLLCNAQRDTCNSTCRNRRMHVRRNSSRHPLQVSSGAGHIMALEMFSFRSCFWVCDALHCQLPSCQSIQLKSWRWE